MLEVTAVSRAVVEPVESRDVVVVVPVIGPIGPGAQIVSTGITVSYARCRSEAGVVRNQNSQTGIARAGLYLEGAPPSFSSRRGVMNDQKIGSVTGKSGKKTRSGSRDDITPAGYGQCSRQYRPTAENRIGLPKPEPDADLGFIKPGPWAGATAKQRAQQKAHVLVFDNHPVLLIRCHGRYFCQCLGVLSGGVCYLQP